MTKKDSKGAPEKWGEFRFSVVGALLSAPPGPRTLNSAVTELSAKTWRHPITGEPVRFSVRTIQRWYYAALKEKRSPVVRLQRRVRSDSGASRSITERAKEVLQEHYTLHPSWSRKLHADNLAVALKKEGEPIPSYPTVCRYMERQGFVRRPCTRAADRAGYRAALLHRESFETRSFESEYVGALWHLDFHHCSRAVLHPQRGFVTPIALCVMDDCSRFVSHLQWYLNEKTEDLVHGVTQALLKVGLPRALMSDNGSAMTSAEFTEGLSRLGILATTTLPYSPNQNGKQERFFKTIEGRLLAMWEGVKDLSLDTLNASTQAWLEMEYHRVVHRELGVTPARKFLDTTHVLRQSPSCDELRMAFRKRVVRRLRKTDSTISLEGRRFEIPHAYAVLREAHVAFASWDLSFVHLIDAKTGAVLVRIYPLDKAANADGNRRKVVAAGEAPPPAGDTTPPLLRKILEDFAAAGIPPAYIPKTNNDETDE